MRITNIARSRNALTNIQRSLQSIDEAQQRATTGVRVGRASDDPSAAISIMASGSSLRAIDQYRRNMNSALARSTSEETALESVALMLDRAKEVGFGQANSSSDAQTRLVAKTEIDQILALAVQVGNTQLAGEYVFGGDQPNVAPFQSVTPPYTTTPPSGGRSTEISSSLYMRSNHNGTEVFLDSGVFAALEALSTALGANDQAAIAASLSTLDTASARVQVLAGENGAQSSQLEVASQNLDAMETSLKTFKANLQDADLESAVTELVTRQTAYQAALLATSRVMGMSLADYLR